MLGYLDALIAALSLRDSAEIQRLLAHPLARLLPEDVVAEASAFVSEDRDALAAPLRAMQLRHQTAELLRDAPLADQRELPEQAELANQLGLPEQPELADQLELPVPPRLHTRRANRQQQMELPLSA